MAEKEEKDKTPDKGKGQPPAPKAKCPECPPPGLPGWVATFSDMVTLLLTFFILLLSFAKTETAKYEAALGSIRNAFGGNSLQSGETAMMGKSPSNAFTMMESSEPSKPFPIEFLSSEGLLDKQEINRASDEELEEVKNDLATHELKEDVTVEEIPEGVKVKINDPIYFQQGSIQLQAVSLEILEKVIKMIKEESMVVFVEGHSSLGETSADGTQDAMGLSSLRSMAVAKFLIRRGVGPQQITTVFYGDVRPNDSYTIAGEEDFQKFNRRVELFLRKVDLRTPGHKVPSQ